MQPSTHQIYEMKLIQSKFLYPYLGGDVSCTVDTVRCYDWRWSRLNAVGRDGNTVLGFESRLSYLLLLLGFSLFPVLGYLAYPPSLHANTEIVPRERPWSPSKFLSISIRTVETASLNSLIIIRVETVRWERQHYWRAHITWKNIVYSSHLSFSSSISSPRLSPSRSSRPRYA